jgi:hypothetical protein
MNQDNPVEAVTKGLILDRLQNYANGTIGSDHVRAIQMDMESAVQKGADIQAVQKYMAPYLNRIMKQQSQQGTEQTEDTSTDVDFVDQDVLKQLRQKDEEEGRGRKAVDPLSPLNRPELSDMELKDREQVKRELSADLSEAANDFRYDSTRFRYTGDHKSKAIGNGNLRPLFNDHSFNFIQNVKLELDELCDRFNVPKLRGFWPYAYGAGARQGDGMMYFNAATFNRLSKPKKTWWKVSTWKWSHQLLLTKWQFLHVALKGRSKNCPQSY